MSDKIQVVIRLRPQNEREKRNDCELIWRTKEKRVVAAVNSFSNQSFIFDRVYDCNETTEDIYYETVEPIVSDCMEGFHGTIFAYGQTASGKTYTMSGTNENKGIIPLAINSVFDAIDNSPNRQFLLRVAYMEIYNERITDLLDPEEKTLKLMEDENRAVHVNGLKEEVLQNIDDMLAIKKKGDARRHVGETARNDESSRSHAIFRMIIESQERQDNQSELKDESVRLSLLYFIDLAGSEKSHENSGDRFREGCAINKSLLVLGQVISKLSDGVSNVHINYRDSKLTRLLQNGLGGNSKTAIICTVNPVVNEETSSTLRFATRAKTINTQPIINEITDVSNKAILKRYQQEIQQLQKQLESYKKQTPQKNLNPFYGGLHNEKHELEKEQLERKYQSTIDALKKMICVSTTESKKKKIIRRKTWCPGLLKRKIEPSISESFGTPARTLDSIAETSMSDNDEDKSDYSISYQKDVSINKTPVTYVNTSVQTNIVNEAEMFLKLENEMLKNELIMKEKIPSPVKKARLSVCNHNETREFLELELQCINEEKKLNAEEEKIENEKKKLKEEKMNHDREVKAFNDMKTDLLQKVESTETENICLLSKLQSNQGRVKSLEEELQHTRRSSSLDNSSFNISGSERPLLNLSNVTSRSASRSARKADVNQLKDQIFNLESQIQILESRVQKMNNDLQAARDKIICKSEEITFLSSKNADQNLQLNNLQAENDKLNKIVQDKTPIFEQKEYIELKTQLTKVIQDNKKLSHKLELKAEELTFLSRASAGHQEELHKISELRAAQENMTGTDITTSVAELQDKLATSENEKEKISLELSSTKTYCENLICEISELKGSQEIITSTDITTSIAELQDKLATSENEKEKISLELSSTKTYCENLICEISELKGSQEIITSTDITTSVAELQDKLATSENEKEKISLELSSTKTYCENLICEISELKGSQEIITSTDITTSVAELQDKLATSENEKEKISLELSSTKTYCENLICEISELKDSQEIITSTDITTSVAELQDKLATSENGKEEISLELSSTKTYCENLICEISELKGSQENITGTDITTSVAELQDKLATSENEKEEISLELSSTKTYCENLICEISELKGSQEIITSTDITTSVAELQDKLATSENEKEEISLELSSTKTYCENLICEISELKGSQEIITSTDITTSVAELQDKLATSENEKEEISLELSSTKTYCENLICEISELKGSQENMTGTDITTSVAELQDKLATSENEKEEISLELSSTKTYCENLICEISELKGSQENMTGTDITTSVAELQDKLATSENEKEEISLELSSTKTYCEKLICEISELKGSQENITGTDITTSVAELQDKLATSENEKEEISLELSFTKTYCENLICEIAMKDEEIAKLQQNLVNTHLVVVDMKQSLLQIREHIMSKKDVDISQVEQLDTSIRRSFCLNPADKSTLKSVDVSQIEQLDTSIRRSFCLNPADKSNLKSVGVSQIEQSDTSIRQSFCLNPANKSNLKSLPSKSVEVESKYSMDDSAVLKYSLEEDLDSSDISDLPSKTQFLEFQEALILKTQECLSLEEEISSLQKTVVMKTEEVLTLEMQLESFKNAAEAISNSSVTYQNNSNKRKMFHCGSEEELVEDENLPSQLNTKEYDCLKAELDSIKAELDAKTQEHEDLVEELEQTKFKFSEYKTLKANEIETVKNSLEKLESKALQYDILVEEIGRLEGESKEKADIIMLQSKLSEKTKELKKLKEEHISLCKSSESKIQTLAILKKKIEDLNISLLDANQEKEQMLSVQANLQSAKQEILVDLEVSLSSSEHVDKAAQMSDGINEEDILELRKQLKSKMTQLNELKRDNSYLKQSLEILTAENVGFINLNNKLNVCEKELESKVDECRNLTAELDLRVQEGEIIKQLEEKLSDKSQECSALSNELSELKDKNMDETAKELEEKFFDKSQECLDLSRELSKLEERNTDVNKTVKELEEKLSDKSQECLDLSKELSKFEERNTDVNKTVKELEEKLSDKSQECLDLSTELSDLKERNMDVNKLIKQLEEKLSDKSQECLDLSRELSELKKVKVDENKTVKQLEEKLSDKSQECLGLSTELSDLKERNTDERKTVKELEEKLSDKSQECLGLSTELSDLKERNTDERKTVKELEEKLSDKSQECLDLSTELSDLKERNTDERKTVKELEGELSDKSQECLDLSRELSELEKKKIDENKTVKELEEKLSDKSQECSDLSTELFELKKRNTDERKTVKELEGELSDKSQECLDLSTELSDLKERNTDESKTVKELEEKLSDKSQECLDLSTELSDLKERNMDVNKLVKELEEKFSDKSQECLDLSRELSELKKKKMEENKTVKKLEEKLSDKSQECLDLSRELSKLKERNTEIEQQFACEFKQKCEEQTELSNELAALKQNKEIEVRNFEKNLAVKIQECNILTKNMKALEKIHSCIELDLRKKLESESQQYECQLSELKSNQQKYNNLQQTLSELQSDIAKKYKEVEERDLTIEKLRNRILELQAQLKKYQNKDTSKGNDDTGDTSTFQRPGIPAVNNESADVTLLQNQVKVKDEECSFLTEKLENIEKDYEEKTKMVKKLKREKIRQSEEIAEYTVKVESLEFFRSQLKIELNKTKQLEEQLEKQKEVCTVSSDSPRSSKSDSHECAECISLKTRMKSERENTHHQIQSLHQEMKNCLAKIEELNEENGACKETISRLEMEINQKEECITDMETNTFKEVTPQEFENMRKKLSENFMELARAESSNKVIKLQFSKRENSYKETIEILEEKIKDIREELRLAQEKVDENTSIPAVNNESADVTLLQNQLKVKDEECSSLTEKLENIEKDYEEKTKMVKKLKREKIRQSEEIAEYTVKVESLEFFRSQLKIELNKTKQLEEQLEKQKEVCTVSSDNPRSSKSDSDECAECISLETRMKSERENTHHQIQNKDTSKGNDDTGDTSTFQRPGIPAVNNESADVTLLQNQLKVKDEECSFLTEKLENIEKDYEEKTKMVKKLKREKIRQSEEIAEYTVKVESLEFFRSQLKIELNKTKELEEQLEKQKEVCTVSSDNPRSSKSDSHECAECISLETRMKSERENTHHQIQSLHQEMKNCLAKIEELNEENGACKETISRLEMEINEKEECITDMETNTFKEVTPREFENMRKKLSENFMELARAESSNKVIKLQFSKRENSYKETIEILEEKIKDIREELRLAQEKVDENTIKIKQDVPTESSSSYGSQVKPSLGFVDQLALVTLEAEKSKLARKLDGLKQKLWNALLNNEELKKELLTYKNSNTPKKLSYSNKSPVIEACAVAESPVKSKLPSTPAKHSKDGCNNQ